MRNWLLALLCLLLCRVTGKAQDTLVIYDTRTKVAAFIPPASYDKTVTSGYTSASTGTLKNIANLSQSAPVTNLYSGSKFSYPAPASSFFDVTSFLPVLPLIFRDIWEISW